MERIDVDDVERTSLGDADLDCRVLSDPLDASDLAVNYYALDPGESFSGGLHAHLDQEEVFYVLEGTATFDVKSEPTADAETIEVEAGEAVRFPPGEFQHGRNETGEQVVALALGAPRESTEIRIPQPCRECGSDVLAADVSEDGMAFECPDCGNEVEL